MRVLGLISGTSADAIDAAIVGIGAQPQLGVQLEAFCSVPYPPALRRRLFAILPPNRGSVRDVCALNFEAGEAFAAAAIEAARHAGIDLASIDLIGSHGQTLFHLLHADEGESFTRSTLQIGEPAVIAERTGITTVADFRVADVAAGGQGAPLVAYVDHALLASERETRVALNIGGIANVTILPPCAAPAGVRAFDTGPGNMLIDECVRRATDGRLEYDLDGRIAAAGAPHGELLRRLLEHPYYARPAPKSTGREQFGAGYAAEVWSAGEALGCSPADIVATVTALTARTIAAVIPPRTARLIVSGGGAHNPTLMRKLAEAVRAAAGQGRVAETEFADAYGLNVDAKEAIAFAVLAFQALRGVPNNLPACTGARHAVVMGKIVAGRNLPRIAGACFASARNAQHA
jgi:anhydro-N-acetylmuramic acid kinase